jgi:TldD protein
MNTRLLTTARCLAVALALTAGAAAAQDAIPTDDPDDPVLQAMTLEVARAMDDLTGASPAPYFLALEATQSWSVNISGEEGALQGYAPATARWLDVDVRIGSPQLDSTHALRSGRERPSFGRKGRQLVLSDDVSVLRRELWDAIDKRFVEAQERWGKVESDRQVLVGEEPAEDLAAVEPVQALHPLATLDLDLAAWEQVIRDASSVLASSQVVFDGTVKLSASADNRWFVSSEGTRLRHGRCFLRVSVSLDTVAEDGEELSLHHSWDAATPEGLPSPDAVVAKVDELETLLAELRDADEQDPYSGPVILSGRASAVFFHEIMGHRMEGHRLKRVDDAQTFRDMVGEPILPTFLSVYDDPGLQAWGEQDLRGHYLYDNQGVPGERAVLVEDGVLLGFLQSRSPVDQGQASNGHGRRSPGKDAVTRQGNLVIEASESVSLDELREELRQRAKEAGLEYGLQIEDIAGGFTFTGRSIPNAFNVKIVTGVRVYVDGRPDELIRGVDLIGTPLVTFGQIVRAGDAPEVFNGTCGAESGWVPVSAVSPALLVAEVETQRKSKGQNAPPLLPPPVVAEDEEVAP